MSPRPVLGNRFYFALPASCAGLVAYVSVTAFFAHTGGSDIMERACASGMQGRMVMRLGPAIGDMPFAESGCQCQVETFLHELSHHAAGTIDDKARGECYERQGVLRLRAAGPARAVRNAENVAFFAMEYGLDDGPIGLHAMGL